MCCQSVGLQGLSSLLPSSFHHGFIALPSISAASDWSNKNVTSPWWGDAGAFRSPKPFALITFPSHYSKIERDYISKIRSDRKKRQMWRTKTESDTRYQFYKQLLRPLVKMNCTEQFVLLHRCCRHMWFDTLTPSTVLHEQTLCAASD